MAEDWRSAAEWAAAAKAIGVSRRILPHTDTGIRNLAESNAWPFRERQGRGGGREYPLAALPEKFRKALARATLNASTPAVVAEVEPLAIDGPRAEDLKTAQRDTMEARAVLLAEIDRLTMGGMTQEEAIDALVKGAAAGLLRPDLQTRVGQANARGGLSGARTLSRRSLMRWRSAMRRAGGNVVALATAGRPEAPIPEWAGTFMRLYGRPQKPSIAEVLDDYWPEGVEKPSYDQARRFLKRLDAVTRNKGRMGPKALQQLKAYTARDVSELWPGAVFIGDGHTHKARVANPLHGQPFRPEVTSILDVYTRKWVGWSAALSENTWAVADALRHALTTETCCDIFYYDNGSGAKNKTWDDDCTGLAARLGFTKLHSAPWGSQARGVVERFHSSVLHRVGQHDRRRGTTAAQVHGASLRRGQ